MTSPNSLVPREYGDIGSSLAFVLRQDLDPAARILDVGCNYGTLLHRLSEHGFRDVYGVDIAEEQIAAGRQAYAEAAPRLQRYDGECLPFEDAWFDAVLMFDVIEHIPHVEHFLA